LFCDCCCCCEKFAGESKLLLIRYVCMAKGMAETRTLTFFIAHRSRVGRLEWLKYLYGQKYFFSVKS
jgi:hypothetical protein